MSGRFVFPCLLIACFLSCARPGFAGAPFLTDDPETPERDHVELDLAARYTSARGEEAGTLPYVEIDYGLTERLALHLLAANAYFHRSGEPSHLGYGDTELGMKFRFLDQDEDGAPVAAAIYPTFVAATGDAGRGLGNGHGRLNLPLWLQRDSDSWKVFGGGGYAINPGGGNRNFIFAGLGILQRIDAALSLGAELFHATEDKIDGNASTGFNLGAIYDLGEQHRLLLSVGRGIRNATANQFSLFFGYQLTP
jgi:hypothetical protein